MKLFHNKWVGKLLAFILGFACALYFGWTFSFFGYWMGEKFQGAFPEAPQTIAAACGVVMFLAVVYTFFFLEYAKEDVLAYEDDKGDGSFYKALKQLKWAVLGLEVFSLLFRLFQLNFALIGLAMVGIGIVLLWLAHLFGKVLHAQVNVPHDVEAGRVMDEAGRKVWAKTRKLLGRVESVDDLRRVADGDLRPIDNLKDATERDRIDSQSRAEQRRKEAQAERNKRRGAAQRHMQPHYGDPADIMPSSNGKAPHF